MKSLKEYIFENIDIRKYDYLFEDFCLDNEIKDKELKKNLEEIYERFEDYKFCPKYSINNFCTYEDYQNYLYGNIILENLNGFIQELKNKYDITDKDIEFLTGKYYVKISIKKSININDFKDLINKYNVNISKISKGISRNKLYIEDIDTLEKTDEVYKESAGILYHLTTKDRINKILKYGLEPRSENTRFDYPGRIYFLSGISSSKKINTIKNILDKSNYKLIKIDLNKLHNKIRFYEDPLMSNDLIISYWTSESIPPYCLESVSDIKSIPDKFISLIKNIYNKIFK